MLLTHHHRTGASPCSEPAGTCGRHFSLRRARPPCTAVLLRARSVLSSRDLVLLVRCDVLSIPVRYFGFCSESKERDVFFPDPGHTSPLCLSPAPSCRRETSPPYFCRAYPLKSDSLMSFLAFPLTRYSHLSMPHRPFVSPAW